MTKKFFTNIIFFLLISFVPISAIAFSTIKSLSTPIKNDFVLSPAKVEIQMDPGQKITKELYVLNRSGEDAVFNVKVEGIETSDGVVSVSGSKDSAEKYLIDKFSIDKKEFTLAHGEQATFSVTVDIPANYKGESFNEVVLISSQRLSDISKQNSTKLITQLGTIFFVKVGKKDIQSGKISDFKYINGKFILDFNNTGKVYISPYGEIQINDIFGNEVRKISIDPWFVLPNSTRGRDLEWKIPVSIFPFYNARLLLNPGYGDEKDTETLNLFLISYSSFKYLFIVLAFIITSFMLIKYFKNHAK